MTDLQQALLDYHRAKDDLSHAEALVSGEVMTDFRLGGNLSTLAAKLIAARRAVAQTTQRLTAVVTQNERQSHANAPSPEESVTSEGPDAPRPA